MSEEFEAGALVFAMLMCWITVLEGVRTRERFGPFLGMLLIAVLAVLTFKRLGLL